MNASDTQVRSAIIQVAADWYAAHRVRSLSESDRAAFLAWLKASPLHIEEYLGVAALERTLGAATGDPALSVDAVIAMARGDAGEIVVEIGGVPGHDEPKPMRPVLRRWRRIAVAAGVSAAAIAAFWVVRGAGPGAVITYRTGHGQQGVWPLPDGSTLHVNTDTAVTVRFSAAERTVEIDHGQVAVKVAHDPTRAFRVHAGVTDAVAVGTEFDVYRRSESTLITVVTGQVAVSVGSSPTAGHGFAGGLRVAAGQQVTVTAGVLPSAAQPADLRESTAWLERKVVFDQRPLAAVADEFNRYNVIPFTIEDPALRRLTISGSFSAVDTDSFAVFLESLEGVRVERLPTRFRVFGAHGKHRSTAHTS